ncbi:hypothetical protein BBJ28_00015965 [Nothophytophthora sp. Chile5]|nr:hypothetical protein BBJ28_00015965 [Nothophytophthora sp. Chile5]
MRHDDDEPGAEGGSDATAGQRASSSSSSSSRGDEASGSTSATLKASLTAISDTELCEVSLLDVLAQAANDVLSAIPAERCVVYVYDKSAHLLRPQVVVDCSHGDAVDKTNVLIEDGSEGEGTGKTPLVSFPPVVGMVSSTFLQRRCLRMQEPNPVRRPLAVYIHTFCQLICVHVALILCGILNAQHRTFHREYDAPKDLQVDSILCAPVILYRRATAVIQLLNRLDETEQGDRNPFAVLERAGTPQDATCENTNDVKLRRLKTIKPNVKFGFSSKDEQKLLHFTTHIAQIANGRSQAKIREDKAKQAMDLLNFLNGKLDARVDKTEELAPTPQSDGVGRGFRVRRATLRRLPRSNLSSVNLLSSVVVVMRLQAMFRGRRERRAQKFAEALERYREQRERVRSVMIIQRVTRRRKTRDKLEAPVLGRSDSNQRSHESPRVTSLRSQTCIYPMPMRPGKNRSLVPRRRLEEELSDGKRDTSSIQENALLLWQEDPDQPFDVQTRRLIASQVAIEKPHRDSLRAPVPPSKPRWHGSISAIWETARDPNRDLIPPGVELAKTYRYRQHKSSTTATIGMTSIGLPSLESPGMSRLPAWRPGPTTNKDALLCCLLPAQPKRSVGAAFALPFPRPPAQIPKLQRMQARPQQGKRPSIKLENDAGRSNAD